MDLLLGMPNDDTTVGAPKWTVGNAGDIQFDASGRLILVADTDLLTQNVGKILLTAQGQNPVDPTYGSTLNTFVGTSYSPGTSYSLMRQTVLDAMGYLVNDYAESANPNEKIGSVETLAIKVDDVLSSSITLQLTLTDQSGKVVTVGLMI